VGATAVAVATVADAAMAAETSGAAVSQERVARSPVAGADCIAAIRPMG
jgi:hypothetical protein